MRFLSAQQAARLDRLAVKGLVDALIIPQDVTKGDAVDGQTTLFTDASDEPEPGLVKPLGVEEVDDGLRQNDKAYFRLEMLRTSSIGLGDVVRIDGYGYLKVIALHEDMGGQSQHRLLDCVEVAPE